MAERSSLPLARRAPHREQARALALATLLALAAGGCKHDGSDEELANATLGDPAARHPIVVSQEPQTLDVRVARYANGLLPRQRGDIFAFSSRARASDAGNSRLVISVPSGSANEVGAMHAVGEIRQILSANGFSEASISVEAYDAAGGREPPIRLAYLRFVAHAPECGMWPTNLAREYQNLPYPNLGCANQRNLAAMVANPADLLGPRTEGERASERRDDVWDKYVHGESTVAKKTDDEKVKVEASK